MQKARHRRKRHRISKRIKIVIIGFTISSPVFQEGREIANCVFLVAALRRLKKNVTSVLINVRSSLSAQTTRIFTRDKIVHDGICKKSDRFPVTSRKERRKVVRAVSNIFEVFPRNFRAINHCYIDFLRRNSRVSFGIPVKSNPPAFKIRRGRPYGFKHA